MSNKGDAHNDILMSLSDEAVRKIEAPETADAPGQWLTVTEAAARLGVSEKTLRKRINSGKIEAHKVTLPAGGVARCGGCTEWRGGAIAPVGRGWKRNGRNGITRFRTKRKRNGSAAHR